MRRKRAAANGRGEKGRRDSHESVITVMKMTSHPAAGRQSVKLLSQPEDRRKGELEFHEGLIDSTTSSASGAAGRYRHESSNKRLTVGRVESWRSERSMQARSFHETRTRQDRAARKVIFLPISPSSLLRHHSPIEDDKSRRSVGYSPNRKGAQIPPDSAIRCSQAAPGRPTSITI